MLRKNIAPVVATILCALVFIVIGSCFSAFLYKNEIVKVENPEILLSEGIVAYDESGESVIDKIELSEMKLGLKPATGEEDSNTNIPVTITDKQGSEGQYAKFKIYAPNGANIFVTDIIIESKENKEEIEKERENIMVAIKEISESSQNLSQNKVRLGTINASNDKQNITFYVWLSSKVSDVLESSTISFKLSLEALT